MNSKCKGFEVGVCLVCLMDSIEVRMEKIREKEMKLERKWGVRLCRVI